MKETWPWFGAQDTVTLTHIRPAGASGIVTALRDYPPSEGWPVRDIKARKAMIEAEGMTWDVCGSIRMHDAIKLKGSAAKAEVAAWVETLRNLVGAGVKTICYNFMSMLDWTRTKLTNELAGRGQGLCFDMVDFVAFDVHILGRPNAEADHAPDMLAAAQFRWREMSAAEKFALESNIIAGLPGSAKGFSHADLLAGIKSFAVLSHSDLQAKLASFPAVVVPEAESLGVRLAVHPDDPPFPLFGLPRCVSTTGDLTFLLAVQQSPANDLTFCTGSQGAHADNDLPAMASTIGAQTQLAHLRNVQREDDGSFMRRQPLPAVPI